MHWDKEKKCFMRNVVNIPYSGTLNECMGQDWEVVQSTSLVRLIPMGRRFKLDDFVGAQVLTKIHGHPVYNAVNSAGQAFIVDDERYVINVE